MSAEVDGLGARVSETAAPALLEAGSLESWAPWGAGVEATKTQVQETPGLPQLSQVSYLWVQR